MTSAAPQFESNLAAVLDALSAGAEPTYVDDIIDITAGARQRPAWSFPGRWLPIPSSLERAPAIALPWRTLGAIVALLLALALAAFVVGNQPAPPPALNGLIAYEYASDIYVADPRTGESTGIVTESSVDYEPRFSPDGTRIAFLRRQVLTDLYAPLSLVVVRSDGSESTEIGNGRYQSFEWSPDGSSVVAVDVDGNVQLISATGGGTTQLPAGRLAGDQLGARTRIDIGSLRPPSGGEFLMAVPVGDLDAGSAFRLVRVNPAGGETQVVVDSSAGLGWFEPAWSPDGIRIGFIGWRDVEACVDYCSSSALYVVNADGSGLRQVSEDSPRLGVGVYLKLPSWSPDGSMIAFERHSVGDPPFSGDFWLMTVDLATGQESVVDGPFTDWDAASLEWSPDGRGLLVTRGDPRQAEIIDLASRERTELPWPILSGPSWQSLPLE